MSCFYTNFLKALVFFCKILTIHEINCCWFSYTAFCFSFNSAFQFLQVMEVTPDSEPLVLHKNDHDVHDIVNNTDAVGVFLDILSPPYNFRLPDNCSTDHGTRYITYYRVAGSAPSDVRPSGTTDRIIVIIFAFIAWISQCFSNLMNGIWFWWFMLIGWLVDLLFIDWLHYFNCIILTALFTFLYIL